MPRPIQPKLNKDYWGFYQVGDYKTYSRLDAVEVSGRSGQPMSWNFNNEVFGQFNWTQEPPGDIKFWYRQRAEQLRDYYDYIILYYSGGWDSDNILRTFVDNNIFIDEVLHVTMHDAYNGNINNDINDECYNFAIPRVKNIIETNPTYRNTKQRIVDLTDIEQKFLEKSARGFDYFYQTVMLLSPAINAYSHIKELDPGIAELHTKYNRVCHLYGIEKPKVWQYQDGSADFVFTESAGHAYMNSQQQAENASWRHDEMFYYTPDMPEIVCKQAHLIHNALQKIADTDLVHNPRYFSKGTVFFPNITCLQKQDQIYIASDELVTDIIYPGKTINVGLKPSSLFFGYRDQWLWENQAPDLGQSKYLKGLVWFKQTVKKHNQWWDIKEGKSGGIKPSCIRYSLNRSKQSL